MELVGIALAAASMADLCIKCVLFTHISVLELQRQLITFTCRYGKSLVAKYRNYQTAERDILELILRVEHHWLKTEC